MTPEGMLALVMAGAGLIGAVATWIKAQAALLEARAAREKAQVSEVQTKETAAQSMANETRLNKLENGGLEQKVNDVLGAHGIIERRHSLAQKQREEDARILRGSIQDAEELEKEEKAREDRPE